MDRDPNRAEERDLGHRNLIASSAALSRWATRGAVEDGAGAVLYASGSWVPVELNGAFRTDEELDPDDLVARADRFFGPRGRGYTAKVRDDGSDEDVRAALKRGGLEPFGEPSPQMICRARPEGGAPSEGLEVRTVSSLAEVADFVAVNADAYSTYGLPREEMAAVFDRPEGLLDTREAVAVVAYDGSGPVAAALTFLSDGIAGLYFVGTVERGRNRGLGRCIATAATDVGFDRGARFVILQASPMGAPVYRAMGYETLYHYEDYIRWTAPPT